MQKLPDSELAPFAKLLGMSINEVQKLVRKGVVSVRDGKLDTAQSLLAVARHLLSTRDTAEAKARTAKAEAELAEQRLKAATESRKKDEIKPGRGKWSKAAGERICKSIEAGASRRQAAAKEGVSPNTIKLWCDRYPVFNAQYTRAQEIKWQGYADDLDEALEAADKAALDPECGHARLKAIQMRIDTRKWQLSKMLPKVYGDRTQMVLETANPADVLPKHTAEQDAAFMSLLSQVRDKTPPPENITPEES